MQLLKFLKEYFIMLRNTNAFSIYVSHSSKVNNNFSAQIIYPSAEKQKTSLENAKPLVSKIIVPRRRFNKV